MIKTMIAEAPRLAAAAREAAAVFGDPRTAPGVAAVLAKDANGAAVVVLGVLAVLLIAALAVCVWWMERSRAALRRDRMSRLASYAAAGIGCWEWNPEYATFSVMGLFKEIMGCPGAGDELNLEEFVALVHPADREAVRRDLERAMTGNRTVRLEHRILAENGDVRHVSHFGGMTEWTGFGPHLYGLVRDVTRRQREDEEVRRATERFMALFKGLPLSAAIWRREGDDFVLFDVNDETDRQTKSGLRLYLGRPIRDAAALLPPGYAANVEQCFRDRAALRTEASQPLHAGGPPRHLLSDYIFLAPDMVAVYSLDLTHRKRMEEALKEGEMRLRTLGDNLPAGVLIQAELGAGGRVRLTYLSRGFTRLTGLDVDGYLDRPLESTDFVHAADLPRLRAAAVASARDMSRIDQEVRVHGRGGDILWLRLCAMPRVLPDGRRVWDGSLMDITGLKQAESALRESESRLRTLGDNLPGGMLFQVQRDPGGVFSLPYLSAGFEGLTGLSPAEAMKNAAMAFSAVHPEDLPQFFNVLENSVPELSIIDWELRLVHVSGRVLWCRVRGVPRPAPDGGVLWDAFLTDITARRRAQSDLKTVLENSPVPIVRVDLGMDGDNRISYLNPAGIELFGPEAVGRSCRDYLCGEHDCAALEARDGRLENVRCVMRCRAGERIALKNVQCTEEGQVIEVLMDVTDQVHAQEALTQARDAAQAASRIKDEFLANMSHEIRTPLNGVMGMISLVLDSELTEEQRSLLQTAVESSRSLLNVINDILDITRIEAGKMDILPEPFPLRPTIRALMENFQRQAAARGGRLVFEVDERLPETVIGDRSRIMQILFNLAGNALKFSEGGEVRVEIAQVGAGRTPDTVRTLFVVSDTGPGIPDDKVAHVFQAFTQADGSLSRRYGGAGLGLGIVRRLVQLMGGNLSVASTADEGTSVHVCLELGVAREMPRTPSCRAGLRTRRGQGQHILVAEDNTVNRIVAVKLLARLGYQAEAVGDGSAVLPALRSRRYDLVLMDVQMPGLDGISATRQVRSDTSGEFDAAIPIIALTAHAMKGDRERFIEAGMDDYVSKPLDIAVLSEVITRHLHAS
ncbi:MAG: PAS domain-containing protein [Desulfovibrionaceae bacterium]|jgi:PAS domain S-box-containing protein|nr:PAS domain-containing protein [Desulfovibrionaceae bacterium]